MATLTTSYTVPISREGSNFDEVSMQQSLLFSDCLKDLKNLKTQLYSAAEYFELSYTNDDQKQIVVETLKDYAVKALVNTVDHLGSVTYKVNDLLDEKAYEMSGTDLKVSCIEQRLKTCQEFIDHQGISQQSLTINTPKYHKRYILPESISIQLSKTVSSETFGDTLNGANHSKSKYQGCSLEDEDEWHQFRNAVRATIRETPTSMASKGRFSSPSQQSSAQPKTFTFTATMPRKETEKREVSPYRFPLLRSGSLSGRPLSRSSSRPTTPNSSRPTTPIQSKSEQRYPSEPRKSASMRMPAEKENGKDYDQNQNPSKSKRLLKALLSRRKSKKDDTLYTYLDEY